MSFRCSLLFTALLAWPAAGRELRVCADPNNLPFSNEQMQGFENRIVSLLARQLSANVNYVWWSERKSFVKNTLNAGRCDVLLGIPSNLPGVLTTEPYYRSSYVLVYSKNSGPAIRSLDDPRLKQLRIGMHVVGNDFAPPSFALARHGIIANVTGFSLFGAYGEPNPAGELIQAVARGDIDLAVAWGPLAGYFAKQSGGLTLGDFPQDAATGVPLSYSMSMGVRKGEVQLKKDLDQALESSRAEIRKILAEYGVPEAR